MKKMRTVIGSTAAAGLMVAMMSAPAFGLSFRDISDATPHHEDIAWLSSVGVAQGWKQDDGAYEFRGMNTVVRQDMAAFLQRLAERYPSRVNVNQASQTLRFRDVAASTPHRDSIVWLSSTGVTTGWKEADGSTVFRGMNTVKRQDMAAFLHRLANPDDVALAQSQLDTAKRAYAQAAKDVDNAQQADQLAREQVNAMQREAQSKKPAADRADALRKLGSAGYFKQAGASGAYKVLTDKDATPKLGYVDLGADVDATSLANMQKALQWIVKCNELRVKEGLQPLKVSDTLMAIA